MLRRALLLILGLVVILAAGSVAQAGTPRDTLVIGINTGTFVTFDPSKVNEKVVGAITKSLYTNLVRLNGKFQAEPDAVEKWTMQKDGKTWLFSLRKGMVFADGSPLKADEVVYSLRRAMQVPTPSSFFKILGLTPDKVTKVDEYTVKIVTNGTPPSVFLGILAAEPGSIVNPRIVEPNKGKDFGQSYLLDHSAGAGPYVLKEWRRNIRAVLEANPKYYGRKPTLSRVIFQDIPEATEQFLLLKKGDIDIAWDLVAEQASALKDVPEAYLAVTAASGNTYLGMHANWGPFKDVRVRQAVKYAIDYKGIIDRVLNGFAVENQSYIPVGFTGYEDKKPFSPNPERAKKLLAEAGYPDGFEVDLTITEHEQRKATAVVLQDNLAKVGIKVNVVMMQGSQLLAKYRQQGLNMVVGDWGPSFPDTLNLANAFLNYDYGQLAYRLAWKDEKAIKLVKASNTEIDERKRARIYRELNDIFLNTSPFAILYQPLERWGVRRGVRNVEKAFQGYIAHFDLTLITKDN